MIKKFVLRMLREMGLRKKATITTNKDGSLTIDRLDHGERVDIPMRYMYRDKEGRPISLLEWIELFADKSYQIIQQDRIGKEIEVSTVWLGIDHGFGMTKPIIFETMIFGGKHNQYQRRYSTIQDALKGHEAAVRLVRRPSKIRKKTKKRVTS